MLRIGKLTDYALLIMSHMAKEPEVVLSASFLAETLHLTTPTVSKILKMLTDASLLFSIRGAEGGYRLARSAAEISVADIIIAMEGLALTECCENAEICALNSSCALRDNWQRINQMVQNLLDHITLVDMLKPLSIKNLLSAEISTKQKFYTKVLEMDSYAK